MEVYMVIASLSDKDGNLIDRWVSGVYKSKADALDWRSRIEFARTQYEEDKYYDYFVVTEKVQ